MLNHSVNLITLMGIGRSDLSVGLSTSIKVKWVRDELIDDISFEGSEGNRVRMKWDICSKRSSVA